METWIMAVGFVFSLAAAGWIMGSLLGRRRDLVVQSRDPRELEELLKAITSLSRDAIVILDAQGRIVLWSRPAQAMFGWSDSEALGRNLGETLGLRRFVLAYLEESGSIVEHLARTQDGRQIPLEISVSRIILGGQIHRLAILRELTERRFTEGEILKAKEDEFEAFKRELEAAIERANLMAMEAELANAAKSAFLANMSHEIRTPMNGIIGMTGLLLDTNLTAEQREYAEIIRNCSEALLSLINDILDFSKIEAGKLDLEILDFDLRLALEEAVDVLAVKAGEKGLEFVCIVDPAVPSLLRGDPGRLRQVVLNLAGNAIKFTSRGEVLIRVVLEEEGPDRVTLRFQVRDTGIGIPQSKMPMLFRPFTQLDDSPTRNFGGTGLGLSISKRLVELMGGSIGVESEPGRGSTFWFTVTMEKQSHQDSWAALVPAELQGKRVLVVDDHKTNRLLLRTLLEGWGCTCQEAVDGQEALRLLRHAHKHGEPFDLAILDMLMPHMDGEELGRRIKENPELRDIRLIMLTSLGRRGDVRRLQEIGFAGYLTKPVRASQLRRCLETVLGRQEAASLGAPAPIVTRHTLSEECKRALRILLVEDNVTNQKVALAILAKLGYKADVAANGREAVAALQKVHYELVLMDCQMPEMDGYEATRLIRDPSTGALNPRVPIIAMTANAMQGDRRKCLEAGMDDYIAKPIRAQELAAAVERWTKALLASELRGTSIEEPGKFQSPTERVDDLGPGPPVFDWAALLDRLLGDEELARGILTSFLEEMPRQVEALACAVREGDAEGLRRWAHTIKGSAGNVGAMALREVALDMEKAAKEGDLDTTTRLMPLLEACLERLREELRESGMLGDAQAGAECPGTWLSH